MGSVSPLETEDVDLQLHGDDKPETIELTNTITRTRSKYNSRTYEPARHLSIRCFFDDHQGQNTSAVLQYRSLLPKIPLQAFIEAHRDDPKFKSKVEEYLGFQDIDRVLCIQVEIPNELLVSLVIARWVTEVHEGQFLYPGEACGKSILGAFMLPWSPGWVFIHVRVSEDISIVQSIVAELLRFNSVGHEYVVLDDFGDLVPPSKRVISTVFYGEWVTITEGPYTNDIGYVRWVVSQSLSGEPVEPPYPMACVRVIPRLCDTSHGEDHLDLGLEATLCHSCRLTRPIARRRRDFSLPHRRSSGLAWNGINVVTGFASVTIPLQHLDVCSFVPLSVFKVFRELELEIAPTSDWSYGGGRRLPPLTTLQDPILPTTVLRLGQPVLIGQDRYIVVDYPDTDATTQRPVVGVIYEDIIPDGTIGYGRIPLQVDSEQVASFPALCCIPLFEVDSRVKARLGKRMDAVYTVQDVDYDDLWLTLKGEEHIIKTRDWHNYQSISGIYADIETHLFNHRPPIYFSSLMKENVSRRQTQLRLIGWEGKSIRIFFPVSSAVHGNVGDVRKHMAKGRRGQVMSAMETEDCEMYPSGVCVLVEIQGAMPTTQVWVDAYEIIDIKTNKYLHVAHPLDSMKAPNLTLRRTLAPLPLPSELDLEWDSPAKASTPLPDDDPNEAGFWREGGGSTLNASVDNFHPSEETLTGFEALRHPRLRDISLQLKYKHKGAASNCIGTVTKVDGCLRLVYTVRSPKTITGRSPPYTGLLKGVTKWLIYEPSWLKRVNSVIVIDPRSPEFGTYMTTFAEDKAQKMEEEIEDNGLIYVFVCKTDDFTKGVVSPAIFSISSHALCAPDRDTPADITPAIDTARKRSKKQETTIIRL